MFPVIWEDSYLYIGLHVGIYFKFSRKLKSRMEELENQFYTWVGDELLLNVQGSPSSKKNALGKVFGNHLKIQIAAVPDGGKATEELLRFLSEVFGVKRNEVKLVSGQFSPKKKIRIKSPQKLPDLIKR